VLTDTGSPLASGYGLNEKRLTQRISCDEPLAHSEPMDCITSSDPMRKGPDFLFSRPTALFHGDEQRVHLRIAEFLHTRAGVDDEGRAVWRHPYEMVAEH